VPHPHGSDAAPRVADVRSALRISLVSCGWTVTVGIGAVAGGLLSRSTVLAAFGAVGFVDGVGSAALAHHFRRGLRHEELADHLEQMAHRIVISGLIIVGSAAIVVASIRLATGAASESSAVGTALAAASVVVGVMLWRAKRRLAPLVQSDALRSDGHLSAVGAALAGVTVCGVAAARTGWSWTDSAAAAVVGAATVAIGITTWLSQRRDRRADDRATAGRPSGTAQARSGSPPA
jgi:divalent metal cation (Fe/Co/Zn/Cd) transporter